MILTGPVLHILKVLVAHQCASWGMVVENCCLAVKPAGGSVYRVTLPGLFNVHSI